MQKHLMIVFIYVLHNFLNYQPRIYDKYVINDVRADALTFGLLVVQPGTNSLTAALSTQCEKNEINIS